VLDASGISPSRIGVICNTSVYRDFLEPGVAVCVQQQLGLPGSCINLDVTNACVGMLEGMLLVAGMIEARVTMAWWWTQSRYRCGLAIQLNTTRHSAHGTSS
jgi:3-oxoacyl-[acyl-carrier-protein] synthase III